MIVLTGGFCADEDFGFRPGFADGKPVCFEVPASMYLDPPLNPRCFEEVPLGVLSAEPALLRFFLPVLPLFSSSCRLNISSSFASFLRSRSESSGAVESEPVWE
jgi:hypothetical protein